MSYALTNAPPCQPPNNLAATSNLREVWCYGHISAVEETALLQGFDIPDGELKSHYQRCLTLAE